MYQHANLWVTALLSKAMLMYPWLTNDWINLDIDHPAFTTDASPSTVSSYIHKLPDSLVCTISNWQQPTYQWHLPGDQLYWLQLHLWPMYESIFNQFQRHLPTFKSTSATDFKNTYNLHRSNPKTNATSYIKLTFHEQFANKGLLFKSYPSCLCYLSSPFSVTFIFTNCLQDWCPHVSPSPATVLYRQ